MPNQEKINQLKKLSNEFNELYKNNLKLEVLSNESKELHKDSLKLDIKRAISRFEDFKFTLVKDLQGANLLTHSSAPFQKNSEGKLIPKTLSQWLIDNGRVPPTDLNDKYTLDEVIQRIKLKKIEENILDAIIERVSTFIETIQLDEARRSQPLQEQFEEENNEISFNISAETSLRYSVSSSKSNSQDTQIPSNVTFGGKVMDATFAKNSDYETSEDKDSITQKSPVTNLLLSGKHLFFKFPVNSTPGAENSMGGLGNSIPASGSSTPREELIVTPKLIVSDDEVNKITDKDKFITEPILSQSSDEPLPKTSCCNIF